jgi:hypothetical protein
MGLNNHQNNILNIVSHKNFVDFMKVLFVKLMTEVYEHAVDICSAVIFHVPDDVYCNLKKPLDDITSKWEDRNGLTFPHNRKQVTIGQHSHYMTKADFDKLMLKWYPNHSYHKQDTKDVKKRHVHVHVQPHANQDEKPDAKQIVPENMKPDTLVCLRKGYNCYKTYEDSYVVTPNQCINRGVPKHMYDKSYLNTCECSKWFNHSTVVRDDGTDVIVYKVSKVSHDDDRHANMQNRIVDTSHINTEVVTKEKPDVEPCVHTTCGDVNKCIDIHPSINGCNLVSALLRIADDSRVSSSD